MVGLRRLLAPKGRRKPRAPERAPTTIVPPRGDEPAKRMDEARERLRREIPPRSDAD